MAGRLQHGPKGSGMTWSAPLDWSSIAKQAFATRHDAVRSLYRPGRRVERHQSRGKTEAYRCALCGAWHVGAGL